MSELQFFVALLILHLFWVFYFLKFISASQHVLHSHNILPRIYNTQQRKWQMTNYCSCFVHSQFTCKGQNILRKYKPTPFSRFINLSLIVASSAVNSTIVAPSWSRTISLLLLHYTKINIKYICRFWDQEETLLAVQRWPPNRLQVVLSVSGHRCTCSQSSPQTDQRKFTSTFFQNSPALLKLHHRGIGQRDQIW